MSGLGPQGGGRIYGQHGDRHAPRGSDPTIPDDWIFVGDDPRVPFVTGVNMSPTADVPNPQPMAFRISTGRPNDCEYDGWAGSDPVSGDRPVATAIIEYRDKQLEFAGDVSEVSPGDIVFVIPMEFRHPFDLPVNAKDDFNQFVGCRLLSTGEYIYGVL